MRGEIVPPSELIVNIFVPPKGGFLIRGGFLLRWGDYVYIIRMYIYIYVIYIYIYYH